MAPTRCPAGLALLLLLLGACGFFQSYAVEVDIKDASNVTCLYAQWMMKFLIKYETNSSDYKNASLDLTSTVTHNGSICGSDTQPAHVAVQFGDGHSWSINFSKNNETYQAELITFTYNTNDTAVFPDARRQGPVTIVVKDVMHPVQLNNVFVCHHTTSLEAENVTQIFWNITMQPFVQNGTISKKVILSADNNNLSKWDASLGNSYMCRKEQTLEINEDLQVHTFNLWVQPFLVKENKFSIAEECFADSDLNFLIPVAVGMALGFLIILVFVSYIIGRRKSRTGYQSV
ncbi:hypothetical protein CIB84_000404 [Bambusicola thoracicus]|uniref:Lysosome-associated membrane glycoprotein 2 n=1 Tax=Bambusicola thoracicus TaxID=9083 RepID=A0A2P4THK8_BAMTH|nr:hypothetical protein CIB84_000404 [Bambusicola thoracicus]